MNHRPRFVSADAVLEVLKWPEMIAALREVYASAPQARHSPRRVVARNDSVWLRALAATPPGRRYMGAKVFGFSKSGGTYAVILFDQESGALAGILDANHITGFRTGATSALGLDYLAPRKPLTVGVLGSGAEAQAHLAAVGHVRRIAAFKVFSPSVANRSAFAGRFRRELDVPGDAVGDARAAVDGADVIIAAARSRGEQPILFGDWLRPGTVVISIGSTLPEQREVDAGVVGACDLIVCDNVDEVVEETGDMIAARAAGIAFDDKLMSLSDLVLERHAARVRAARLPMLKTAGAAVQDLAVAELAFTKALAQGLTQEFPGDFRYKPA
ncbi:ornithine cyclodeaminase family protein [Reyranella sp. CPCC 100927]|uniref:ornithine cyclodeaminase family protein n=1 Tax=Reyranella sp. CPCC 100927 TaxID=2599616 RepID=UPI0015B70FBA|nr:ornithine cyclodeaminase family protein [Reyranella sp. CPCC 100927]